MQMTAPGLLDSLGSETITYYPRTGGSRQIEAIVEYLGPQPMDGLAGGSRPAFDILVKNHPTQGLTSRELDTGGDKIKLPMRIDLAGRIVRLTKIMAQDKAMLRLRAW